MAGVNKVILVGNLGADPEIRYTPGGMAVATFKLATSETFSKDGKKETRTEWHRVVAFNKLAEICGQYLSMLGSRGESQHAASDVSVDEIPATDIDDVPF